MVKIERATELMEGLELEDDEQYAKDFEKMLSVASASAEEQRAYADCDILQAVDEAVLTFHQLVPSACVAGRTALPLPQ